MNQYKIKEYGKLNDLQKEQVAEILIEGFGHLLTFSKDKEVLKALFLPAFNPNYIFAYSEDEVVQGILGLGTNCMRPIKFEMDVCIKLFGKFKGSIICRQLNGIFQSQAVKGDCDLYIDVLATSKNFRGKGIGTKLLNYSLELPHYTDYYIEVLSKNTNAKRLYEQIGFETYKEERFSMIALLGYGYPIKMKLKR